MLKNKEKTFFFSKKEGFFLCSVFKKVVAVQHMLDCIVEKCLEELLDKAGRIPKDRVMKVIRSADGA